jgi:hypothetical protein
MAKCLISLSEETVAMLMARRNAGDDSLDAVVRRVLVGSDAPTIPNASLSIPFGTSVARYQVRIFGEVVAAERLHDVLATVIESLSRRDAGFLTRLAKEKGRKRRIVARSPEDLYPDRPDLAKSAREVADGWWMVTIISRQDTVRAVATACRVAGVVQGVDVAVQYGK